MTRQDILRTGPAAIEDSRNRRT